MLLNEDYRPKSIDFEVDTDGTCMPLDLGDHKNLEECMKIINTNFSAINHPITVNRHMDNAEKKSLREQYNDVLENVLPKLEKELSICTQLYNEAKKNQKNAEERVSASMTEVRILSKEVKNGLKTINLDDLSTVRIPYMGKYYYYTYIDGSMKLCAIRDIPEHEKGEIFNVMANNEKFVNENFGDDKTQE